MKFLMMVEYKFSINHKSCYKLSHAHSLRIPLFNKTLVKNKILIISLYLFFIIALETIKGLDKNDKLYINNETFRKRI